MLKAIYKAIIVLQTLIIAALPVIGQDQIYDFQKIIPPSPNAASLESLVIYPFLYIPVFRIFQYPYIQQAQGLIHYPFHYNTIPRG